MKQALCFFTILFLCLSLLGCKEDNAVSSLPDLSSETVTEESFFHTEEDGKQLVIALEANPTTGYDWNISFDDDTVCEVTDVHYLPDSTEEGLCGGGGIWTAKIRALKEGDTILALRYARSWEEGAAQEYFLVLSTDAEGHITAQQKY